MATYQLTTVILTLISIALSVYAYKMRKVKSASIVPIARDRIMESIKEGIMVVDEFGKIIDKNTAIEGFITDIMGGNREIPVKEVDSILHAWPCWLSACKDMKADEFEIEALIYGRKRFYLVKVYPLSESNIKRRGTVSLLYDITESKSKEEELLSTTELSREQLKALAQELNVKKIQLESIIENMSDHCVVVDKAGKYIVVNKAAKELFSSIEIKKTGDYLKAARYFDIQGNEIHTDTVPAARVMKGEKLSNYRLILRKDENEIHFDVNGTPVYDKTGEFLFGVICSHDVTKLVQRKEKLKLQNKQLETIINTVSDMTILYIADKDGNFLYYSKSANGYFSEGTFESKAGSTYRKGVYFYEDGSEIELFDMPTLRVLRGEKISSFHFVMKAAKGETHFLLNGTPVYDEDGNLKYGVFFNQDITEQVLNARMIPVMEHLEALNSLKDKLFTVITHDIRDPLAAMVSLTEFLEAEKECFSSDAVEIIESVKVYVNNTFRIAEDLLQWFKSQREGLIFSPMPLKLSLIVEGILGMYNLKAEAKGVMLINSVDEDTTVFADKEMLEVVLRNLLSNAIKYTGKGGLAAVNAQISDEKVIVTVSDNGIGIHPEKAKTLFKEAHAGNASGTEGEKGIGLGLLICKEYVQRSGGEIWLESIPGKGSTFSFTVPSENKGNAEQVEK